MRWFTIILLCLSLFLLALEPVRAEPTVTGFNIPTVEGLNGESFELKFEIRSDETADYTIKLTPRAEFEWPNGDNITLNIPANDTRTFKFLGQLTGELAADGKYNLQWAAFQNDTQFTSGSVDLRVGEQAPGIGLGLTLVVLTALVIVYQRKYT